MYLSQSYEQKGMFDQAVEADLQRHRIILPEAVEPLRTAFLQSGIKGFWRKQVEIRKEQAVKFSMCEYEIATRYALLGETAQALQMIEDNYRSGGTCWNQIKTEPAFDSLRTQPRYQAILRQMKLD